MSQQPVKLKRTLSLPVLALYGLGTIVGAGIYVLVGKVAAEAGDLLPLSFLIAGVIAVFTALSYSELAARFPRTAGAALYVEMAFGNAQFSRLIGWLVIFTGVVSAATIINGFNGYLSVFVDLPPFSVKIILVLFLTVVAAWGIKESAVLITVITLLEVGGLLYVFYIGLQVPVATHVLASTAQPAMGGITGLLLGSFLAFYAFIGFEDMVNIVEEAEAPSKNLPIAILASVVIATLLYVGIAIVALNAMPVTVLATSEAPLADLVIRANVSPSFISGISLIAVINGALVQIIMASRVIYGMSCQGIEPAFLGHVNHKTRTPVRATILVGMIVLTFAVWLPLVTLASLASTVMLTIFSVVNLGLIRIKRQGREIETFSVPFWVPIVGALLCISLLTVHLFF